MVCIRFSACSKAMLAGLSKTSSVTSMPLDKVRVLRGDLGADDGLGVVERRQAMHELHPRIACRRHQLGVHLEGEQHVDPVAPRLQRLAHGHPHVGVDEVDAADRLDADRR